MEQIISKIFNIIKKTDDLITFEEQVHVLMNEVFSDLLGDVFDHMDQVMVRTKQESGWKVKRRDKKVLQFTFGEVRFNHTLMGNEKGESSYPFDTFMGIRKYQRYSSLVEVKTAELASENTYRETAKVLRDWTAVKMSHQTVGSILKKVGEAQAKADEALVKDLDESAELPSSGKKLDFLMVEADGVFVRGTERKKSIEVRHAITYEGWDKNGKRVALKNPTVLLTTQPTGVFWSQIQANTAHRYMLDNTQVVSNSDGGLGYTADRFQEAFSQSRFKVLNQLDSYHISQSLNRTFGANSEWKDRVKKTIQTHEIEDFILQVDTYESMLEDEKQIEKLKAFRSYIVGNWHRIFDWRTRVDNAPSDARSLGAMESNQRHVSFRMKKRGMHWSVVGCEAMIKVKQGILNGTLREVYLKNQQRSMRKKRTIRKLARMSEILRAGTSSSIGAKQGIISLYTSHSSPLGNLVKSFR